jgi:AraC-like DNA-binding protein
MYSFAGTLEEKQMGAYAVILIAPLLTTGVTLTFARIMWPRQLGMIHLCWAMFALSVLCFTVTEALKPVLGYSLPLIATIGNTTCGFSWLLARALFRPLDAPRVWPFCVVAVLFLSRGLLHLIDAIWPSANPDGGFAGMLSTVHALTSSTALVLALIEVVDGWSSSLPKSERKFRLAFIAAFLTLFSISMLWARPAASASSETAINIACSVLALIGAVAAVMYRASHPLLPMQSSTKKSTRNTREEDKDLAITIIRLLDEKEMYRDPAVKVVDLAKMAGEPEYKVSRAISGVLGYANFNQLINYKRVEYAKRFLSDPGCNWSVLAVALDSGFGSIGPFNRAFKTQTGMTASEFRITSHRRINDQSVEAGKL